MHQSLLEITKDKQSTTLVIGSGKDHFWRLQSPVSGWPRGTAGSWARRRGATKFRQFSMIELLDSSRRECGNSWRSSTHERRRRYGAGSALPFFLRAQSRSFSWKNSSGRASSVRKPLPVP